MSRRGLECPNPKCRYMPGPGKANFRTIKTMTVKGKVLRARVCPNCGWDFISEEVATSQPFYKKKYIERILKNG